MPTLRTLLFLSLLGTCACAQKTTQPAASDDTTSTTLGPVTNTHDHPAEVAGLGPVTATAFGANLYTPPASVTAEQVMDSIRAAFPGKAIYLDLWAVWCMPCIGEFPASKRLHGQTSDLPVEFVYLCTSSRGTEARWKSIINGKELPGTHVFVDRLVHGEIMDRLRANSYPTYVVVKADGKRKYDVRRPSELSRQRMQQLIK
ncbi:TlpA family protein disulfide reductase [Neolewinella antarctica]|uniref:Thiol-disulfide isomerase/thioredoxin n=1 Tax=Neolewinella antarctica TaxID=442734 RepID=A0ABX0XG67_9BACT|nr:TlpA disulfide reductase family protein [Neolewinella antarctica]NJC27869.1 thiol-disulfide isomerase/thioredoxin [Neolewinella antarctica]